jgi:hypothetical protein
MFQDMAHAAERRHRRASQGTLGQPPRSTATAATASRSAEQDPARLDDDSLQMRFPAGSPTDFSNGMADPCGKNRFPSVCRRMGPPEHQVVRRTSVSSTADSSAPLLDHFGTGSEKLCIHRAPDGISGALILCSTGFGRWSCFRPSQVQPTAVMLEDARLLETLLSALPGQAWTIELHAVDPRYAPEFSRLGLPQIVDAQARTIGVQPEGVFSDYWTQRPKNLAKNVRPLLPAGGNRVRRPSRGTAC